MTQRVAAVLVVPNGTHRPQPLAGAIARLHPAWEVGAVWCGDPQLRPPADGVDWLDDARPTPEDEVALVAGETSIGEWRRAVAVVQRLMADGVDQVVALWVGSVAVAGSLDALTKAGSTCLVPALSTNCPSDDLVPTEADLVEAGLYSTTVACFGPESKPLLEWLAGQLTGTVPVGPLLTRAAQLFAVEVCSDASIGVGRWRWDTTEPALIDVDGYDSTEPWTLDPEADRPARVELIGHPERQSAMTRVAEQLTGRRTPLHLPGGVVVDAVVREVVAESATPPPPPWSGAAAFRTWLAPRYWPALHAQRSDLQAAFPDPHGRSAIDFERWCKAAFTCDDVPLLVVPPSTAATPVVVADSIRTDGFNLVGYLTRHSGLGDVARRLRAAASEASVPYSTIATQRSASPSGSFDDVDNRVEFTNSLCVVTADQFPFLATDFPQLFAATRRMIGLLVLGARVHTSTDARSDGVGRRDLGGVAVRHRRVRRGLVGARAPRADSGRRASSVVAHPCRLRRPLRPRRPAGVPHGARSPQRDGSARTPVGTINAFRKAFEPGEGPVLIVKTMNGHQRWSRHQRLLAAADGRDDIRVWDETLTRDDQMALVAAVDCMVSLHRSEGLGLHLAEAMWLGTPTIATRYSGNLDFMNDDNSLLVDATLVNVERGEGVYPPTAQWAEPDVEQAVAAMRSIVSDAALRSRLASAGRQAMARQPSLADTGRLVGRLVLGGE
jgi:hypothetical protein